MQTSCRPILDSLLPNLFQFGPTTPESHISDYHNQPRTHLNVDNPESPRPTRQPGSGNSENPILNPQIIGTILNLGRALLTNAVGNLFSVGQATAGKESSQAMKQSTKNAELAIAATTTTMAATTVNNIADAAGFVVMEPTGAPAWPLMQKDDGDDAGDGTVRPSELKSGKAQRRAVATTTLTGGVIKLGAIKRYGALERGGSDGATMLPQNTAKNENEENNAGVVLVEHVDESDEKKSTDNNGSTEIIDAFFDLNADDIFYNGNGTIQRPRLFPLIISSLLKYRNQSDQGLLNNSTLKERQRVRLLYTLRPIVGVLRRKAENSKLREQLRAMEDFLEQQLQSSGGGGGLTPIPLPPSSLPSTELVMRMRRQASSLSIDRPRAVVTTRLKQPAAGNNKADFKVGSDNDLDDSHLRNNKIDDASDEEDKDDDDEVDFDGKAADDGDEEDNNDEVDENDDKSNVEFGETFSILLLEIIGTVAGLAYGAFNQLSHFIVGMGN